MADLQVNDTVRKTSGDYTFTGVVVSAFTKRSGARRYVVENNDGILHIFSGAQLEPINTFRISIEPVFDVALILDEPDRDIVEARKRAEQLWVERLTANEPTVTIALIQCQLDIVFDVYDGKDWTSRLTI